MTPRLPLLFLLVVGGGCKKDDKLVDLFAEVSAEATGVYVGDAVGVEAAVAPAFLVNRLGAAVGGEGVSVTSDGAVTLSAADATGWGTATVTGAPGAYSLVATSSRSQWNGTAWLTAADAPRLGFDARVGAGVPTDLLEAGNGLLEVVGNELWWVGEDAGAPTRVASFPDPVLGLQPAQGDNDGVTDAVAWTRDAVVLLRGRAAGGLYWGAGWETSEGEVRGARATDLDGDGALDLAVLTVADGESTVSVYTGDGSWGFALTDQLELAYEAWSVGAEDLDLDGQDELTLLTVDGLIRRYARFEEGWSLSGSYEYSVEIADEGRLHPSVDLTADGIDDLLVAGLDAGGGGWQAWVIDAGGDAVIFRLFVENADLPLPGSLDIATAEVSGDAVADLVMLTEEDLYVGFWSVDAKSFVIFDYPAIPGGGPVTAADLSGDAIADVVVGASQLSVLRGQRVADDPDTPDDETVAWKVESPDARVTDFLLAVPPVMGDLDGDGVVDLVSAAATSTGLELQVYGGQAADTAAETFRSRGTAALSVGGTARDLARCGDDLYVTVQESSATYLHHYGLDASGGPVQRDLPVVVQGHLVACGPLASAEVAVVSASGTVEGITGTASVVLQSGLGTVYDAVGVDGTGAGVREVVVCGTPSCSVAAADLDGDGAEDAVTADGASVTVDLPTGVLTREGPGVVSVGDADGDGAPDVSLADGGEVQVFRVVPGGLVPASATFVWRPVAGPASWGDLDGDGLPDLFLTGAESDPDDGVDWSGTLTYTRARGAE